MKKLSILIVVIVFSFVSFSFVHGYGFPVQELNEKNVHQTELDQQSKEKIINWVCDKLNEN